jgi:large repetitive protein
MQERAALAISICAIALISYCVKEFFSAIPYALLFKTIKRPTVATALSVVFIASIASYSAMAQEPPQAAVAGARANRVVLPYSTHPATKTVADLGRLAGNVPMDRMVLVLAGSANEEQSLQGLLDSLHTKGSPRYHQWLTPEEFRVEFGASPEAIQKVTAWLAAQGFNIDRVARSGRWIQFSGAAMQVEAAFQTEMHRYHMDGITHIGNASDLSLPAELAPLVSGVLPLHDFSFKRPLLGRYYAVQRNSQGNLVPVDPAFTVANPGISHFLTPGDYSRIYDLASLYQGGANGAGQTIAIVARGKVEITDVETFRSIFGLPANDPTIIVDGPDPGFTFSGDSVEASLDVEWAGAVAPNATIDLVVSASTATTDGVDLSSAYIVDNNLAPIMTVSFGECESALGTAENAFYNSLWQQAAAQGISVFVSSGDGGAAGCDDPNFGPATGGLAVSGLASTPFNTAVGGTEFSENGNDSTFWNSENGPGFTSVIGYIPETVWNESCDPAVSTCLFNASNLFAGGGGASTIYAKPSWQVTTIPGVPNDGHRDIPDVSLAAAVHDGFLLCFEGACQTTTDSNGQPLLLSAFAVGGTSAASPSFAGIMAIIDQQTGERQGLANYVLYPLAAAENFGNCNSSDRTNPATGSSCVFNDVTAGNNSVPGQAGFNAGTGYDLAAGLGSVNAANLIQAFVTELKGLQGTTTLLAANGSTSLQHGQPVSFTANVTPASGNTVPTGNVSIITSLQGAAGPGSVVTIGAGTLSNGVFTGSFANLPGGQYNVSAHYPGDTNFKASDSNAVAVNVAKEGSTTSLISDASFPYGEEFPIHTIVTGTSGQGHASGTMTFTDGSTQLGLVPLNIEGQADFLPSGPLTLTVGAHTLGASYSGDNSFNPSTAQPVTITITKAIPGLEVATFSGFTGTGTASVFVFNTGPILPTGTAQLFEAGKALGNPVPLVSISGQPPTANFTGLILTAGFHDFSVSYSGDSVYQSTSFNFQVPVFSPFAFDPALNSGLSTTVSAGQTATYNLILSAEFGFTGTVALSCSGAPAGTTCNVSPASAVLSTGSSTAPVTVTVTTTSHARNGDSPFKMMPFAIAGAITALSFAGNRKRLRPVLLMLLAVILGVIVSSCGGGGSSNAPPSTTSAILTITGTSNGATNGVSLQLTITH